MLRKVAMVMMLVMVIVIVMLGKMVIVVVVVMVFIFMIWRLPSTHAIEKAENEENKNQQNCWGHPCKIIIFNVSGLSISVQNYYLVVDAVYEYLIQDSSASSRTAMSLNAVLAPELKLRIS